MGLLDSLKRLFNREEESEAQVENVQTEQVSLEIDEEDRMVIALAASVMAGKDKSGSHYHISSIKRVK
jgi:pantothenate kinase